MAIKLIMGCSCTQYVKSICWYIQVQSSINVDIWFRFVVCAHVWGKLIGRICMVVLILRSPLTHLHSEQPKEAWLFWEYFTQKNIFLKTFEGEMLIRSQTKTLIQIFCELLLYSQVIFESMKVADDTFWRNSECQWVKVHSFAKSTCITYLILDGLTHQTLTPRLESITPNATWHICLHHSIVMKYLWWTHIIS